MKYFFESVGAFFKGIGTKIGGWSLALKIAVPVAGLAVITAAGVTGVAIHRHNERLKPVVAIDDSETTSQEETEKEQLEQKMQVGIRVPQKTDCWVAYSSIEKDLSLYLLDADGNAITGKTTSVKLVTESQANELWDSIKEINAVTDYLNQAKSLEEAGSVTDELRKQLEDAGNVKLDFEASDVDPSISYITVDSKGREVQDASLKNPENKTLEDLSVSEKKEFDAAYDEALKNLKLSDALQIYKENLTKKYATLLEGIDAAIYTDDNADGVYYIQDIAPGTYYACLVPEAELEPREYASLSKVKDKIEYKKVEHIEAEVVEDKSEEPKREESEELKDTVTFVSSSSKKNLPEYSKAGALSFSPVVEEAMKSSDSITVGETEVKDPLQITSGVAMYPIEADAAKMAQLKFTAKTENFVQDTLTVEAVESDGKTKSPYFEVTSDENGVITLIMKKLPTPGTEAYVRVGAKYLAADEEEKDVYVLCKISIYEKSKEIKDTEGRPVYVDDKHHSDDRTLVTVGNYKKDETYYYETKEEYQTYYGWQNLNGQRYYFDENGVAVTGEQIIRGTKYTFGGDGILLTAGTGVDVSRWQGDINWKTMASQVSFAIIKCGGSDGGRYQDKMFEANIKGIKETNLAYGLYFFCYAKTEADAVKDASLAIELANKIGSKFALPIYCDYEGSYARNELSVEQNTKNVLAFCKTIENAGYKAGVYADSWMLTNRIDMKQLENYSVWVARYADSCNYKGPYDIWQYSNTGDGKQLGASSTYIDMNKSFFK